MLLCSRQRGSRFSCSCATIIRARARAEHEDVEGKKDGEETHGGRKYGVQRTANANCSRHTHQAQGARTFIADATHRVGAEPQWARIRIEGMFSGGEHALENFQQFGAGSIDQHDACVARCTSEVIHTRAEVLKGFGQAKSWTDGAMVACCAWIRMDASESAINMKTEMFFMVWRIRWAIRTQRYAA